MNTTNQYKLIKTKSTISETTNAESERTISQSRSQNSTKEKKEIVEKKLKSRKSKKHLGCRLNKSQIKMSLYPKTTEKQKTPEEITNFFDSEFAKNYKGRGNKKNPFTMKQDDFNKIKYTIKDCVENRNAIEGQRLERLASGFESQALRDSFKEAIGLIKSM